jgi:hypothetical protein
MLEPMLQLSMTIKASVDRSIDYCARQGFVLSPINRQRTTLRMPSAHGSTVCCSISSSPAFLDLSYNSKSNPVRRPYPLSLLPLTIAHNCAGKRRIAAPGLIFVKRTPANALSIASAASRPGQPRPRIVLPKDLCSEKIILTPNYHS